MKTLIVLKATHDGKERRFSEEDFEKAFDIMKKIEHLKDSGMKIFHSMTVNSRGMAEVIGNSLEFSLFYTPILNSPLDFSDIETLVSAHENEAGTIVLIGDSNLIYFVDFYAHRFGVKGETYPIGKIGGYILSEEGLERIKGKRATS